VDIDTPDEVLDGGYDGNGLMDIRTYKEKVIDYLAENTNNPTILKIRNLEPINADDLKELERVLWTELGTKDEYDKMTDIDNLAAFIRSIVGIEQDVINEKFGEFLSGNVFNSQQQEFVKSIIDYVRENGDINVNDLIEKSPFDNYDIITMFGPQAHILRSIVDIMHNSIMAA
jgi:type I restriction enzyme R subunit